MQSDVETIPCGRGRDLRVGLSTYKGIQMVQVRQWVQPYHSTDDSERVPTKSGISFKGALLPEMISALEMAQRELKEAEGKAA